MLLFVVLLLGLISGIILTIGIQWYLLHRYFLSIPCQKPNFSFNYQHRNVKLPEEILKGLDAADSKKETCLCLNLILQFLFKELRDTLQIKRWFLKKLSLEFEELLQRTTTGKLLEQIMVQDLFLGNQFPVIKAISTNNVQLHESGHIEELDVLLDLEYMGGFQLSITADMVLGKSAFLSVKITKLQGQARLQFTRLPYTHWSFAFYEEPVMDFQVESHFQGRPLPQITSLIINQIRRTIRKRHTLPHYKIRYKPFFTKQEPPPTESKTIHLLGNKITEGVIEVTVVECSRLFKNAANNDSAVYCTLAVDNAAWVDLFLSCNTSWVNRDLDIIRQPNQPIGITFKQDDDSTSGSHGYGDEDDDSTDSGDKVISGRSSLVQSPVKRVNQKPNNTLQKGREKRSGSSISTATEIDGPNGGVVLRKTSCVKFVEDPCWRETLTFEVEDHQRFLNVCIWCQNLGHKGEKQDKSYRSEKDILLGHVSIPLLDIAMECASNMNGTYQRTFQLSPPEPKPLASRNNKLASHPGFDESLCYGDVTLILVYQPRPISKRAKNTATAFHRDSGPESDEEGFSILTELSQSEDGWKTSEHDFIITQFQNTVVCQFCNKKVWLKMAFQCRCCGIVCHKKCVAKCQASRSCEGEGNNVKMGAAVNIQQPEITTDLAPDNPLENSSEATESSANVGLESSGSLLESPRTQRRLRSLLSNLAAATRSSTKNQIEGSTNLTRTGSVHNLAIPSQQCMPLQSKSLPPSPQASPAVSRKASLQGNLFQTGHDSDNEEDLDTTVQRLLQYSNDEMLVLIAKEKGRELFTNLSLEQRKEKLNAMITKVQNEIDLETENRNDLAKKERQTSDLGQRTKLSFQIAKSDEKIQAVAILMLYYYSGLQYCQELEESVKVQTQKLIDATENNLTASKS